MSRSLLARVSLALLASAGCASAVGAPPPAPPGRVVLVELFTSEGCSSCPAADAFVAELPRLGLGRDRVVPLAFHVDYWDDLGWKDPFASPAFTERQRRYVRGRGLAPPAGDDGRGIDGAYTPQMIVDGRVHFSGRRRDTALAEIARAAARPAEADLAVAAEARGEAAVVTARVTRLGAAAAAPPRGWTLTVALAAREARTAVARGENAGATLTEAAIVRTLADPVAVTSSGPLRVTLAKPRDLAWDNVEIAAFVEAEDPHRIIAARAATIRR